MTIQDDTNSAWLSLETSYEQLMSAVRGKRVTTTRWTYFQGAYDWLTKKIKKEEEEIPSPPPEPPPVDIDAAWKIFQFAYGTLVDLIRRADTRLVATPTVPPPPADPNYDGLTWEQRLDALLQGWVRTDGTINYDSPLCPFKR